MLTEPVARESPRLAHEGVDDVPVIDAGFPLAPHPLHAFHQVASVEHLHGVRVQPDLHFLPDQARRHRVGPSSRLYGAPLAHPGTVVDVFRHRRRRQRLQMKTFHLQLPCHQPVAPLNHHPDEARILLLGVEVATPAQHECLIQRVFQPVVRLFDDAVLIAGPRVGAHGLEPVVLQQLGVGVVQCPDRGCASTRE